MTLALMQPLNSYITIFKLNLFISGPVFPRQNGDKNSTVLKG